MAKWNAGTREERQDFDHRDQHCVLLIKQMWLNYFSFTNLNHYVS